MSPPPTDSPAVPASSPPAPGWFEKEVHVHDAQLKAWIAGTYPAARSEAQDIAQESYVHVWKRQTVKPIASVKAFLFTVARNLTLDFLRRHKASDREALSSFDAGLVTDTTPNAAELLTAQERFDLLAQAVASLPSRQREIILLHKIEGLPMAQVALQLNLSLRTAENHCYRGIRACAQFLQARGITAFRS